MSKSHYNVYERTVRILGAFAGPTLITLAAKYIFTDHIFDIAQVDSNWIRWGVPLLLNLIPIKDTKYNPPFRTPIGLWLIEEGYYAARDYTKKRRNRRLMRAADLERVVSS